MSARDGRDRPFEAGLWTFAALYAVVLFALTRDLTWDYWDGFQNISNALRLAGHAERSLNTMRPAADWLLLWPVAALAYRAGGPFAALAACHALMCALAGALVAACGALFRKLYSRPVAAACALLAALNPLLLRYAPFALFDGFAGLAGLPFLWLGWRYVSGERPPSYGALFAAYLFAFLARYQLGLFFLAPLAYLLLAKGASRRAVIPLALLPAGALAAGVALTTALVRLSGVDGWRRAVEIAGYGFYRVLFENATRESGGPWTVHLVSLAAQLGVPLFAALAAGLYFQARERRGVGFYLALALLLPLAVMSFGMSIKEQRHNLMFLPLVYAALGEALSRSGAFVKREAWAALAALALAPWGETRAALDFIAREPTMRDRLSVRLAEEVAAKVPAEGCARWTSGGVWIHPKLRDFARDEQMAPLDADIVGFLSGRRVADSGPCAFEASTEGVRPAASADELPLK